MFPDLQKCFKSDQHFYDTKRLAMFGWWLVSFENFITFSDIQMLSIIRSKTSYYIDRTQVNWLTMNMPTNILSTLIQNESSANVVLRSHLYYAHQCFKRSRHQKKNLHRRILQRNAKQVYMSLTRVDPRHKSGLHPGAASTGTNSWKKMMRSIVMCEELTTFTGNVLTASSSYS